MTAKNAETDRARRRLTEASDAWLEAYEGDGLTDEIAIEYHAAYVEFDRVYAARRLDPNALAPPLEGGDWGFEPYEDLLDGGVAEPSDESDGAE